MNDLATARNTLQDLRLLKVQFKPHHQKLLRAFFETYSKAGLCELVSSIEGVRDQQCFLSDAEALGYLYFISRRVCVAPDEGGDGVTIVRRLAFAKTELPDFHEWLEQEQPEDPDKSIDAGDDFEPFGGKSDYFEGSPKHCLTQAKKILKFLKQALDFLRIDTSSDEEQLKALLAMRRRSRVQVADLVRVFVVARRMKDSIDYLSQSSNPRLKGTATVLSSFGAQSRALIFHEPKGKKCGRKCIEEIDLNLC